MGPISEAEADVAAVDDKKLMLLLLMIMIPNLLYVTSVFRDFYNLQIYMK